MAEETEKFLSWGQGMTAFLPKQVKVFADGAIFLQAMQVSGGYKGGHDQAASDICTTARMLAEVMAGVAAKQER